MKTVFFILVSLLSILWIYLSFHFFNLDVSNMVDGESYNNIFFELIFFVGLFVFGFFLGRFFSFNNEKVIIKNEKVKKVENKKKEKKENNKNELYSEDDNLKIIEGIGPKIEQLLKLNGINSLKELSETGYDELKLILERAGDNYKIINPRSWPYQSELATKKEWGKLKEYQDFLVGGIDPNEIKK